MISFIALLVLTIWIIAVFLFAFSWLVVIKNIYSFVKVLVLKEGTVEHDSKSQLYFALAVAYIITFLVI